MLLLLLSLLLLFLIENLNKNYKQQQQSYTAHCYDTYQRKELSTLVILEIVFASTGSKLQVKVINKRAQLLDAKKVG